jgi:hypothetical protein
MAAHACALPRALAEQLVAALSPQLLGGGGGSGGGDARGGAAACGGAPPHGGAGGAAADDGAASAPAAHLTLARMDSGVGADGSGAPASTPPPHCREPSAQLFLSYRVPETGHRGDRSIFSLRTELQACGYRRAARGAARGAARRGACSLRARAFLAPVRSHFADCAPRRRLAAPPTPRPRGPAAASWWRRR